MYLQLLSQINWIVNSIELEPPRDMATTDAVDFPSGGQDRNGIITNKSKLIKLIKLIDFWCAYKYQRVRLNLNQVLMQ